MKNFPKKCVVDTNVPMCANLFTKPDPKSDFPDECIIKCICYIENITKNGGLVIDDGDEIFSEYRNKLSLKGQPGVGDIFAKWVHDHGWNPKIVDRIQITKNGDSYKEFPAHEGL